MTSDKPTIEIKNGKRINGVNRRSKDFHRRYLALCRAKNFQPLSELAVTESTVRRSNCEQHFPSLNVYGDRFKECDWLLIIDALLEDTSLEMVAIRLRKVPNDTPDNRCQRMDLVTERPTVLTNRLFSRLIDSLGHFLVKNQVVSVFTLEALPIHGTHMSTLVNGLQQNCSITELSFARSAIRDEGSCHLTARGCHSVAELIKYQKIQRFAQSWQHSLRYRNIDTNNMQGLRNILLNGNRNIGDEGLIELTEILKDDEWIRQVHLRNCGLTDKGAKSLVDCLNINKTIEKFDIRANLGISNETCYETLIKLGVEVESSDSNQSFTTGTAGGKKLKPSEQIKFLQHQLAAERHRSTQLQLMVETLHLQQTEFNTQMNKLKHDFNQIVHERDDLLIQRQNRNKERPKSRRSNARKCKSEALPKPCQLFSPRRVTSQRNDGIIGITKSEIFLRAMRDPHSELETISTRQPNRSHMLERAIGDGGLTSQLNDITELNEELGAVHNSFTEGGCGDNIKVTKVGQFGAFRKDSLHEQLNEGTSDEDYFIKIGEAADHWTSKKKTNGYVTSNDEEDDLDETSANSFSGADLLKMIVKKCSPEHTIETQSMCIKN
ncbi:protein Cep78 homolog isoform X2 [Malaya genurostris]|uniref:protein Cep78 homolog isoform X2 n=1 Tax=Malaya genurostris TaxID=325434 RepID=UPI0026F3A264|nr:protein Cep78 homolog isoform X2 [Malaya genurostris]